MEEKNLKLYVIGETDGSDPEKWGGVHDTILVLAENAEVARVLAGDRGGNGIAEVLMDKAKVLITMSGAEWV